jgi:hypothetical protein
MIDGMRNQVLPGVLKYFMFRPPGTISISPRGSYYEKGNNFFFDVYYIQKVTIQPEYLKK